MTKLAYVYEGITNENGRNELVNKKYFGGVYEGGKGVEQLWEEVWDYIEDSYDTEELVKIYINGDGAAWIKSGQKRIAKAKFVLDRFHMHKYIIGATPTCQRAWRKQGVNCTMPYIERKRGKQKRFLTGYRR